MLTDEQKKLRRGHIGASDSPQIVLPDPPFGGPIDVYNSKVFGDHKAETEAMGMGNLLEGPGLDFLEKTLNIKLSRASETNLFRVSTGRDGGVLAAIPDAIVFGKPAGCEVKYVNQSFAELWGEEGTNEVPDHVAVQTQHQMYVWELERVYVAVFIAGFSLSLKSYMVPRDDELIGDIVDADVAFWKRHIEPQIPPEGWTGPSLDCLSRRKRIPKKIIPGDPELVARWLDAKEAAVKAKEDVEAIQSQVIGSLDDAEALDLGDGSMVTYLVQRSSPSTDYKRMRMDGVFDIYCVQGTHPVLRFKKGKG